MPVEAIVFFLILLEKTSAIDVFKCKSFMYNPSITYVYLILGLHYRSILCMHYSCKLFREAGKTDKIYKTMEIYRLRLSQWSFGKQAVLFKCEEFRNKNILFRDGMVLSFMHSI